MLKSGLYFTVFGIVTLANVFCSSHRVPDDVFCLNESCDKKISSVKAIKSIPIKNGIVIPKNKKLPVFAKSVDNRDWKILFNEEYHYIDASFFDELSDFDSSLLQKVSNPDKEEKVAKSVEANKSSTDTSLPDSPVENTREPLGKDLASEVPKVVVTPKSAVFEEKASTLAPEPIEQIKSEPTDDKVLSSLESEHVTKPSDQETPVTEPVKEVLKSKASAQDAEKDSKQEKTLTADTESVTTSPSQNVEEQRVVQLTSSTPESLAESVTEKSSVFETVTTSQAPEIVPSPKTTDTPQQTIPAPVTEGPVVKIPEESKQHLDETEVPATEPEQNSGKVDESKQILDHTATRFDSQPEVNQIPDETKAFAEESPASEPVVVLTEPIIHEEQKLSPGTQFEAQERPRNKTVSPGIVQGLAQCINSRLNSERWNAGPKPVFSSLLFSYFLTNANLVHTFTSLLPASILGFFDNLLAYNLGLDLENCLTWALIVLELLLMKFLMNLSSQLLLGTPVNAHCIKGSQAEIFALKEKTLELSSRLTGQQSENLRLQAYSTDLLAECSEFRDKLSRVEAGASSGSDQLRMELKKAKDELEHLRTSHDAIADELERSKNSWIKTEEELIAKASASHQKLQDELDKTKNQMDEAQNLHNKLVVDLENERNQLEDKANDYSQRMLQMQNVINEYQGAKESLEAQLQNERVEYKALCESINQIQNLNSLLEESDEEQEIVEEIQATRLEWQDYDTDEEYEESTTDEDALAANLEEKTSNPDDEEQGDGWEEDGWNEVEDTNPVPRRKTVLRRRRVTRKRQVEVPFVEMVKKTVRVPKAQDPNVRKSSDLNFRDLLDMTKLKSELAIAEEKAKSAENSARREQALRQDIEERLQSTEESLLELRSDAEASKNEIEFLKKYFEEREAKLQEQLQMGSQMHDANLTEVGSYKQKCEQYEGEVKQLKDQIASLVKKTAQSERSLRRQLVDLNKRAHENWLDARKADSDVRELKEENSELRQKMQQQFLQNRRVRAAPSASLQMPARGNVVSSSNFPSKRMGMMMVPPPPPPPMQPMLGSGASSYVEERTHSRQSNGTHKSDSNRNMMVGLVPPPPPPFPMMMMAAPGAGSEPQKPKGVFSPVNMMTLNGHSPNGSAGNSSSSADHRRKGKKTVKGFR